MSEQNQPNWNPEYQPKPQENGLNSNGGEQMNGQGDPQWNSSNQASYLQTNQQAPAGQAMYQPQQGMPSEASYQNYDINQRYAQSMPGYEPPKPKSKVGLFIALGLAAVLLIGLGAMYAFGMFAGKTNVEKLLEAMFQGRDIKQMEAYMEVGVDELKMAEESNYLLPSQIVELIQEASLNIHMKADSDKSRFDADMRLNLKNVEVLDVLLRQQGNEQIVSVPKLFRGNLYFSGNSLDDQVSEIQDMNNVMDSFSPENVEKAMKYLQPAMNPTTLKSFKTLEKKKYFGRIKDRYNELIKVEKGSKTISVKGSDAEIKGDVYEIKENMGEMAQFYFDLFGEMLADENFKPFLTEYLERLISTAEVNKDVLLYNYITLLNGSNELKKEWDEDVVRELVYQKEVILDAVDELAQEWERPSTADNTAKAFAALKESGSEISMVFVVDKFVKYSDVRISMNILKIAEFLGEDMMDSETFESLKYHITSAILAVDSDVKLDAFDKSDALDYANANADELNALMEEMQGNLMQIIFSLGIF